MNFYSECTYANTTYTKKKKLLGHRIITSDEQKFLNFHKVQFFSLFHYSQCICIMFKESLSRLRLWKYSMFSFKTFIFSMKSQNLGSKSLGIDFCLENCRGYYFCPIWIDNPSPIFEKIIHSLLIQQVQFYTLV